MQLPNKLSSKQNLALLAIVLCWTLWGTSNAAIKIALLSIPVFSLLFFRLLLSLLIISPKFLKEVWSRDLKTQDLRNLLTIGIMGTTLSLGFLFLGLHYTTSIQATLIFSLVPLFEIISGSSFLKEKITHHEVIGVITALLGTIIVFVGPLLTQGNLDGSAVFGNLLVLLSALWWVSFTLYSKKKSEKYPPVLLTGFAFASGALTSFPLMLYESFLYPDWFKQVTTGSLLSLVYLALFCSVTAFFLYEWSLKKITVSRIGVYANIQILVSLIIGATVLEEDLSPVIILGVALIILGVIYSSLNDHPSHRTQHKYKV